MKKILIIFMGISIFGLVIYIMSVYVRPNVPTSVTSMSTPTPLPFQELTIPFLRNRSYQSRMGEPSLYQDNEFYTSYLTSYDSDGLMINALLTKPKGDIPSGGWPAIIFIHGYIPPTNYQTTQNYVDYVDYLARNGFVIFKIDLRGHGKSQGAPGGAYYSGDYIIDTLNARAALQTLAYINKDKIGLWGHSMAGNIVLRTLAAKPEIPAAVIWAGAGYTYQDLLDYRISDFSYQPAPSGSPRNRLRQQLLSLYGEPASGSAFWKQMAPTSYLNDLKGAIQIHHALDDTVVSIKYSQNLVALLDQTHVPHEFYTYPTGGHNIRGSSFIAAMERTVKFYHDRL